MTEVGIGLGKDHSQENYGGNRSRSTSNSSIQGQDLELVQTGIG